jgi:Domain of unknown function (DUF4350)
MPSSLSSGDRKVLIMAAAAFLILIVLGFLLAPTNTETNVASTYSTASQGAKAAYLLLQEMGYHVERWQQPLRELLTSDEHTVLIIADPPVIADQQAKTTIERFVWGGGHLITNGMIGASLVPEDHSEFNAVPHTPWSEFDALTPSAITRAAPKITLAPVARWSQSSGIALYGNENDKVAIKMTHGHGDVVWLASATPFTNAGITQSANLEFVLAAIGDKEQTRVLFDEYVHGYGEHSASPGRSHPIMAALLVQSGLLALAVIFTFSRRSGPLRPLPVEPRLAPLEFVETLGGLYLQAKAASVAVDVWYQRFQYWTTRRLGLAPTAAPEELARAVGERWMWGDETFVQTLRDAASARYRPDLRPNEALAIVKSLYLYAVKLKLFPSKKEKS